MFGRAPGVRQDPVLNNAGLRTTELRPIGPSEGTETHEQDGKHSNAEISTHRTHPFLNSSPETMAVEPCRSPCCRIVPAWGLARQAFSASLTVECLLRVAWGVHTFSMGHPVPPSGRIGFVFPSHSWG